jgi:predicted nucleic acid-binding protein
MPELADWMERNSLYLYLSVITVAEVEDGIAKARRTGATRKADHLAAWLETLLHLYSARILPLDTVVARLLGTLTDQARAAGLAPGLADLAIAATAASRNYTILTRNLRHFRALDVPSHDPFESLPDHR